MRRATGIPVRPGNVGECSGLALGACALLALPGCVSSAGQENAALDGSMLDAESAESGVSVDAGSPGSGGSDRDGLVEAAQNGTCTNTQSDPANCGICDHDCAGAACVAGACAVSTAPSVIVTSQSPTWIAVDATSVYWMNKEATPAGASGNSALLACPVAGCVGAPGTIWSGVYPVDGLAESATTLVWSAGPGPASADGSLGALPEIMGCADTGCGMAATAIATVSENISSIATDAVNVYWTTTDAVRKCPLTGCGSSPVTLASGVNAPGSVTSNGQDVFWTTESGNSIAGQIMKCAAGGCGGTPTVLVSNRTGAGVIAADGSNVYWVDNGTAVGGGRLPLTSYTTGQVLECAVTGCGDTPSMLASYATWLGAGAIATDGTDVYWSVEQSGGTLGAIVKCAVGGCGGTPTLVGTTSTQQSPTVGLALDATRVYWSDPGSGRVLAVSK